MGASFCRTHTHTHTHTDDPASGYAIYERDSDDSFANSSHRQFAANIDASLTRKVSVDFRACAAMYVGEFRVGARKVLAKRVCFAFFLCELHISRGGELCQKPICKIFYRY